MPAKNALSPPRLLALALLALVWSSPGLAQSDQGGADKLREAAQNPISDLISVPFQNNLNFATGKHSQPQDVLNIQPVIPIKLNEDWNLITRWILPVISQPPVAIDSGRKGGLGDFNPSFFFSPREPVDGIVWGVGPTFVLPTATEKELGTGKYSAGPTGVIFIARHPWTFGALINNVWSFTGQSTRATVNQMTLQPFVNYNLSGGWYLTSSPLITANWQAKGRDVWTVPVGGGFGRIFKIGEQPVNMQLAAYYNVAHPKDAGNWQLRAELQLLFPTK